MTALVTGLALVPLVVGGNKAGQEIGHPMALVIAGGLFSSTALTLLLLPAFYLRWGSSSPSSSRRESIMRAESPETPGRAREVNGGRPSRIP